MKELLISFISMFVLLWVGITIYTKAKQGFYEKQELAEINVTIKKKPVPGDYEWEIRKCPKGIDDFIKCQKPLQGLRDDI